MKSTSSMQFDRISEYVRSLAPSQEVKWAFLYGSAVEGFANSRSDVDVGLVSNDRNEVRLLKIDSMETHLEFLTEEKLRHLIRPLLAEKLEYAFNSVLWYHRMKIAHPIYGSLDPLIKIRDQVNETVLSQQLTRYYSGMAAANINDSVGGKESDDVYLTVTTCRQGIEFAALAALSSHHVFNPQRKWIYRNLLKTFGDNDRIPRAYLSTILMGANSKLEIDELQTQSIKFVGEVTLKAQVP